MLSTHVHAPGTTFSRTRAQRLGAALALNLAIVVAEAIGGALAHSSALLADGGHNLADAAGLLAGLIATRLTLRSPTGRHSFGFHRATVLAAAGNVAVLLVVTGLVVASGIERLIHPAHVAAGTVLIVAAIALVANGAGAALVYERRGELTMRAALVHLAGDALSSLAVLAGGAAILATGHDERLDPAISLGVACLIALQSLRVGRESLSVLFESTPSDVDLGSLARAIGAVDGVAEVHDLHCWSLSSEVRALSAHLVLAGHPSLEQAHVVGEQVKQAVRGRFAIAHSTLELECERCVEDGWATCTIEDSGAAT